MVVDLAPSISAGINQALSENGTLNYAMSASDDKGSVSFSATGVPSWLTFSAGTFSDNRAPDDADVGTSTITVTVADSKGQTASTTFTVTVNDINEAPSVEFTGGANAGTQTFNENDGLSALDNNIQLVDADPTPAFAADNVQTVQVQITGNYVNGEDILQFTDTGAVRVQTPPGFDAATGTITLESIAVGGASVADFNAALQTLNYDNTSEFPSELPRALTLTVTDVNNATSTATHTINVNQIDDAPILTGGSFGSQTSAAEQINSEDTNGQERPHGIELADGRIVVVWDSSDPQADGSGAGIGGRFLDANGQPTGGGEFIVNSTTTSGQARPAVDALADGGFVVVYMSEGLGDNDGNGIGLQRMDSSGNQVGTDILVNTVTTTFQLDPDVTVLSDGKIAVTYSSDATLNGVASRNIAVKIYNSDLTVSTDEFRANTATTDASFPKIVAMDGGKFAIVYAGNSNSDILMRILNTDGTEDVAEFIVSQNNANTQTNPDIALLSNGDLIVTWQTQDNTGGATSSAAGRVVQPDGTFTSAEFKISEATTSETRDPDVTALDGGGFVVSYMTTAGGAAIRAREYQNDGTPVAGSFEVTATGAGTFTPQTAIIGHTGGGYTTIYQDVDASSVGVFAITTKDGVSDQSFARGGSAVRIDNTITLTDLDTTNFDGATLDIAITANNDSDDRLSIVNEGTGAGQIGFDGTTVTYGGTAIGVVANSNDGDGTTPLELTLNTNATTAAVQALLRAISFDNVNAVLDETLDRDVDITLTEQGGVVSNTFTRTIDVVVNNAPTQSANPATVNGTEDTTLTISTATFSSVFQDADGGDTFQAVRIDTLPAASIGTLQLNGVDITANQEISLADLNANLLTFVPAPNANVDINGNATFTFSVGDGKSFAATPATATVDLAAVNDEPEIDIAGATAVHRQGAGATLIAPNLVFTDVDAATATTAGQMNGGFLQADISAGRTAGDLLSINDQGTGAGQIGFDGSNVTYEGTIIGTVAGASDGGSGEVLRVTFNANATPDAIEAVGQAITYRNVDASTDGADRTISFSVNDGALGGPTVETATVSLNPGTLADDFNTDDGVRDVIASSGDDDYATVSYADSADYRTGTNAFTWEAWIESAGNSGTDTILSIGEHTQSIINADFTTTPTNLSVSGTPSVTGGTLLLTPEAGGFGTATIDPTGAAEGARDFTASFDLKIGDGTVPAGDGMSFNYGVFESGVAEEGISQGLALTFDTFDNGGENISVMEVKVNGTVVHTATFPNNTARTDPGAGAATFENVTIVHDANGLDVSYKGVQMITDLDIVTDGYNPQTDHQFIFGARTGGVNDRHEVDNLQITANNLGTRYALVVQDGDLAFVEETAAGATTHNSNVDVFNGGWHHVGARYDGAGNLTLFVDGTPVQTFTGLSIDIESGQLVLGSSSESASVDAWSGMLAELRTWTDARSDDEILANFRPNIDADDANLSGYWKFDAGSGTTVTDASGNGNTLTFAGGGNQFSHATSSLFPAPDSTKWVVVEGNDSGTDGDTAYVEDGELVLVNREVVRSATEFDPSTANPIHVSGRFSYQNEDDILTVATRSNATPDSNFFGYASESLNFDINDSNGANTGQINIFTRSGSANTDLSATGDALLDLNVGAEYDFDVFDDGTNVRFIVSEVGNPQNRAEITSTSAFNPGSNYVTVHNREDTTDEAGTSFVSRVSDLRIDQDLSTAEGESISGVLFAPSSLTGSLTFEALDNSDGVLTVMNPATGAYTFAPTADFHGQASFSYQVIDANGVSHVENINVNVIADTDVLVAGNHLVFDGVNDYAEIGRGAGDGLAITDDLTVEGWFNTDTLGSVQRLVSFVGDTASGTIAENTLYDISIAADGKIVFTQEDGAGNVTTVTTPHVVMIPGEWVHVAVVRNAESNTITVFVDGVPEVSTTYTNDPTGGANATLTLGGAFSGGTIADNLDGRIDDIRIWDTARTEDDIRLNYNQQLSGSETGMVANYSFDNVQNGAVFDKTANGNNGQLGTVTLGDDLEPTTDTATANVTDGPGIYGNVLEVVENEPFTGFMVSNEALDGAVSYAVLDNGGGEQTSFQTDNGGLVTINAATGEWTYTPITNSFGADTFTLRASGATSGQDDEVITVNISGGGDEPSVNVNDGVLSVDGTDDHVKSAGTVSLTNFTLEAQFRGSENSTIQGIVATDDGTGPFAQIATSGAGDGRLLIEINDGTNVKAFNSSVAPLDGDWHHVALTYDDSGNGIVRLFIDGIEDTSLTTISDQATTFNVTDEILVGIERTENTTTGTFTGEIDDVRVWDDVRTPTEIATFMDQQLSGAEDNLQVYYRFDGEAEGTSVDNKASATGAAMDGTLSGDARIIDLPSKAARFDGANDQFRIADLTGSDILTGTGSFTYETWFQTTDTGSQVLIGVGEQTTNGSGASLRINGNEELNVFINKASGFNQFDLEYDGVKVNDGQWHHAAMVYDADSGITRLFLDGQPVAQMDIGAFNIDDGNLRIGSGIGGASDFNGDLADVRIWNTARTDAEIANSMNSIPAGNQNGNLVAHYTFDDLSGNVAVDSAGTNDAALEGDIISVTPVPNILGNILEIQENDGASGTFVNNDVPGTATFDITGSGGGADADGFITATSASGGTVRIHEETGDWTYEPAENYHGNDTFTLTATGTVVVNGVTTTKTDNEVINVSITPEAEQSASVTNDGVLSFDGVDDFVRGDLGTGTITNQMSFEVRVLYQELDGHQDVIRIGETSSANDARYVLENFTDNTLTLFVGDTNGFTRVTTDFALSEDTWYDIAVTLDGTTASIYVDGNLIGSGTTVSAPLTNVAQSVTLGADNAAGNFPSKALVDEVRVWDTVRTPEEIQETQGEKLAGTETGLLVYYDFNDEGEAGVVQNLATATGNASDGIIEGNPKFIETPSKAVSFDGVDDVITVTNPTALDTPTAGTWSFWMKSDGTWATDGADANNTAFMLSRVDSASATEGLQIGALQNGDLVVTAKSTNGASTNQFTATGAGVTDNVWHNVTVVYGKSAGDLIKVYVDGDLVDAFTTNHAWDFNGQDMLFGQSADAHWEQYKGQLDNIQIYDRALTDAEVADIFTALPQEDTTGLVGYYQFEESTGLTATNSSTDANKIGDGALTGGVARTDASNSILGNSVVLEEGESAQGFMTADDVVGSSITYGVTGGVVVGNTSTLTITDKGTVTIDTATGAWEFTPLDNFNTVQGGALTFDLTAAGDHGITDIETMSITVNQSDNASVIMSDGVLDLDGTSRGVVVADNNILDIVGDLTMEAWINPEGPGSSGAEGGVFINKEGAYALARFPDGSINFALQGSSTAWSWVDTGYDAPLNTWTHISVVYDAVSREVKTYANGDLVGINSNADSDNVPTDIASVNATLNIGGRSSGDHHFDGQMDEVRIWDTARTAEEVRNTYDKQTTGEEFGLVGAWHFDENPGEGSIEAVSPFDPTALGGELSDGASIVDATGPVIKGLNLEVTSGDAGGLNSATGTMISDDVVGIPTFSVQGAASNGTVNIDANTGVWTYTPDAGYVGADSFTLRAAGGGINDDEIIQVAVHSDASVNVADGALQLNGTASDYVDLGNSGPIYTGTGDFTYEAWVNSSNVGSRQEIISIGNAALAQSSFFHINTSGQLQFDSYADFGPSSAQVIADGAWHHTAVTYEASTQTVTLYVDGDAVASQAMANPINIVTGTGAVIGRQSDLNTSFFDGSIDDVRIWNETLTPTDIETRFDQQLKGDESGLQAYFRFDETGTIITDHSANSNSATIIGGNIVNSLGRALEFDGTTTFIDAGRGAGDSLAIAGDITVETWLKLDQIGSQQSIVDFANSNDASVDNVLYQLVVRSDGDIEYAHEDGSGVNSDALVFDTNLLAGNWYHISMSRDVSSKTVKLFLDGQLIGTQTYSGNDPDGGSNSTLAIGATVAGSTFGDNKLDGQMSDLRIWSTARTDDEIVDNYNQTLTGNQGGTLQLNYRFDEISGSTVTDSSGTQTDATVTGTANFVEASPTILANVDATESIVTINEDQTASGYMVDHIPGIADFVAGTPSNGSVVIDSVTGAWTYTPTANFNGTDTFTLSARDAGGNVVDTDTVKISVNSVDDGNTALAGGSAIQFNPTTDFVEVGRGSSNELAITGDLTVEGWFNIASVGIGTQSLISFNPGQNGGAAASANNKLYELFVLNDGKIGLAHENGSGTVTQIESTVPIDVGEWVHVAAVRDTSASTITMYVNGNAIGTTYTSGENGSTGTYSNGPDGGADSLLTFGGELTGSTDGMMDEVRIWNAARTSEEIRANYDQQISNPAGESNLQGYWNADASDGRTINDLSSNNNDALLGGGKVLTLDGTGDYVQVPDDAVDNLSTGTIEAWVYLDSNTGETIFSKQHDGVNTYAMFTVGFTTNGGGGNVDIPDGILAFRGANAGGSIQSNTILSTGEWHHVAVTFDGTEANLYIDGRLDNTEAGDFSIPADANASVDARIGSWSAASEDLDGKIDEFRVWDDVRTASEIADNAAKPLAGNEANLVLNYDFDSDNGGTFVTDNTANSNDGTLQGNASLGLDSTSPIDKSAGAPQVLNTLGGAVAFDGDDHIEVTSDASLNLAEWTIETWFQTNDHGSGTGVGGAARFVSKANSGVENGYSFGLVDGNLWISAGSGVIDLQSTQDVTDGQWYHATASYDGSTLKMYINGELVASKPHSGNAVSGTNPLTIGTFNTTGGTTSQTYTGNLSDVRVWNEARTDEQVAANYNKVLTGDQGGALVAHYPLNEITGGTIQDTANNNDGSTVGDPTAIPTGPGVLVTSVSIEEDGVASGQMTAAEVSGTVTFSISDAGAVVDNTEGITTYTVANEGTTIIDHSTGIWTFTPVNNYNGNASFNLTATGNGATDTQPVTVTVGSTPVASSSIPGNALQLDREAGAQLQADLGTGTFSDKITLEFKVNFNDITGAQQSLISLWDDGNKALFNPYLQAGGTGVLTLNVDDQDAGGLQGVHLDAGVTITAGTWYDVAMVLDGTTARVYIDGELTAEGDLAGAVSFDTANLHKLVIGGNPVGDAAFGGGVDADAMIDDIRIWNTARTSEQIRDDHDQQLTGDEVGLQAHYRFDEEFNGTVVDQTSNGFDASVPRKSVTLDGTGDYIQVTDDAVDNLSAGTIETWVYLDSNSGETIFSKQHDGNDSYAIFSVGYTSNSGGGLVDRDDGILAFRSSNGGGAIDSVSTLETGQWHHVAVTFTNTEANLYINGQLDSSAVGDFTIPNDTNANVDARIGSWSGNNADLDGKIDDFRVWTDVRTQAEIQANMNKVLAGDEANLSVYYDFDREIDGSTGSIDNKAATIGSGLTDGTYDGTRVGNASVGQDNTSPVENDGVSQISILGSDSALFGNTITIEQDGTASGAMTANDVVGSSVSYSVTAQGSNGTVTMNSSNGQWTYTPDESFSGTDTFNIRATGGGLSDIETITVTVNDDSDVNIHSSALQFDGVNDVVSVAHDNNLNLSASGFTVELWVNAEGSGGDAGLLDKMDQTPTSIFNGWKLNLNNVGTAPIFYIGDDDAFFAVGHTTAINDGAWHHVAAVYDANNSTIEIYVDGVAGGSPVSVSSLTVSQFANTENLLIGSDSSAANPSLNGMMDDVRIWSEARTAQEIADNFDKSLTGNETNLEAYWKFDQADGATITDVTGNGHNATLGINNNTTPAQSVSLDGDLDYVEVPTTVVSNLSAYTIEAKVFLDENTGEALFISQQGGVDTRALFSIGYGKNSSNTAIETKTAGTVSFSPSNGGGLLDSVTQLQTDQWYHVAVTFDGTTARLYIDGQEDVTSSTGSFVIADASGADYAAIGGGPQAGASQHFNGDVAEFRVWDKALTATEVADNVNGNVANDANGLLVEYTFDNVIGNSVQDNTANGNNGTLTNDAVIVANDTTPDIETGTAPTLISSLGKALDFDSASNQYINVGRGAGDNLAITGDLTVETWVNLDSIGTAQKIASFRQGQDDSSSATNALYQLTVGANGDVSYFHENSGSGDNTIAVFDTNLVAGQWYHLALVRDDTAKTITLYVNDEVASFVSFIENDSTDLLSGTTSTYTLSATGGASASLQIGKLTGENQDYLDGQLSDLRIWDVARTSAEISANKDGLVDPASPGLVLNYAFDELNGTTVEDRSSSGNDGTTVNSPVIVDTAASLEGNDITIANDESITGSMTADVTGTATFSLGDTPDNGSLSLDAVTGLWEYKPADGFIGTDSFVIRAIGATSGVDEETVTVTVTADTDDNPSPTSSALQLGADKTYIEFGAGDGNAFQITGDVTFETWINPSELADATIMVVEGASTDTSNINNALALLMLQADGSIRLLHEPTDQNQSGEDFIFPVGLTAGTWAHLSAVRDATADTWTLYVNGEAFGARSYTEDAAVGTSATLKIGGNVSTSGDIINEFSGQIADTRIWDDVRTSDEVRDNYNQQLSGNEPNLVGYYTYEGDTTAGIQDRTSNNHDGYLVDNTPASVQGNVLELDGTGDYVELNYAEVEAIDLTAGTIETWIKIDDDTKGTIFAQQHGFTNSYAVFMVGNNPADVGNTTTANDGKLFFRPQNAVGTPIESTSTLTPGEWHHVAVTFNGSGATLYIDGVADASVTGTNFSVPADPNVNTPTGTQAARIGDMDGAAGNELDGQLSNFRIWSEVRTAEEIREGMAQSYDYDTNNLAVQYTFDDVNGTAVADTSFSSTGGTRTGDIDGTLTGNANVTSHGAGQTNILSFLDQAVRFDGNGDTVTLTTDTTPISGTSARTFMTWANTADATGEQVLFKIDGDANPGSQLVFGLNAWNSIGGGTGITLDIGDAAITYAPVSSTADGNWHHYAVVIPSGGTLADAELYQDGIRLTTVSARFNDNSGAVAINTLDSDSLTLSGAGTQSFNGNMAESSVWSAALTAAEIQQYMSSQLDGNETGLEGYWRGDTNAAGDLIDYSANGNDGTLTGNATVVDVAPNIQSNNIQIIEDTIATGRMTGADVNGAATFSVPVAAANGTVTIDNTTGVWNYTPNAGFAGTDTFTLRATGTDGSQDDETVSVRVGTDPIAPHDYALTFDGTDDYVDLGTVDNIVGAFSAEAWVKFENFADGGEAGFSRIFDIGDGTGGGNGNGFLLTAQGTTGELALYTYNGGSVSAVTATQPLPLNEWTHVAAVNDGAGSATLFVNGSAVASTSSGPQLALPGMAFESSYIGRSTNTNDSYFNGQIADARIWDTARTTLDIANNYDRQLNGDEEGLAGYWNFNEGSGSVATDLSGNGNDGAVIGATYADLTTITDAPPSGQTYKGLVLGADADGDNLSYTLNTAGNGAVTVDADGSFDYTSTGADDSFTVDITDDDNNTTTHTVNIDH